MRCASLLLGTLLLTSGCLPGDTRPDPGSVLTTVSGSSATRDGFTTVDGWNVEFDTALVCAGPMQLGDDCQKYAEYSEPGYDRILELTHPPQQKLSIMFGLGTCGIDFQLGPPSGDAVLGGGVSETDKAAMRTPASDAYVQSDGMVLHVEGSASDGTRTLRFDFSIRQSLFYVDCSVTIDGVTHAGLVLEGGKRLEYDLAIDADGIFRQDVPRESALRFAPFATADDLGNGDGTITLDELDAIPIADLQTLGPYSGGGPSVGSLSDYVYRVLWPTLLVYRDTGICNVSLTEN